MDKAIIEKLQLHSSEYLEKFKKFPYKNDPVAVFEFEYNEYVLPMILKILPTLSQRLITFPNEKIEFYLPYISERYHSSILIEISNLLKNHDYLNKKKAKEIEYFFNNNALKYIKSSKSEQEGFIIQFISLALPDIILLSKSSPIVCLSLISLLRNPRLQKTILKHHDIQINLYKHINEQLVHEPWDSWIDNYFTYPRTKDMNEYFDKWIGRDKLHIKMCSNIFAPEYYEQAKMWLKGREKQSEISKHQK